MVSPAEALRSESLTEKTTSMRIERYTLWIQYQRPLFWPVYLSMQEACWKNMRVLL